MKILAVVAVVFLIVVVSLVGYTYYWLNHVVRQTKKVEVGPFTIQADAATGKNFNINYGFVDATSVAYSIWYQGKPVQPPGQLESNTGLPYLWKVYEVKGTSEPTLIAGSQSLFMVKLKGQQLQVMPLFQQFSDFATLQFLDSDSGQPGEEHTVFSCSSVEEMDKIQVLEGGKLLLVCGLTVVDIETGKQWSFSKSGRSLNNYSFPNPAGALALSPDRQSIVFSGEFQTWNSQSNDYIKHAMVVFDYQKDIGYTLPFDHNELRLRSFANVTPNWFAERFEWTKDYSMMDRLRVRDHDKPYPWIGEYKPGDNYYYLYPIKKEMFDIFFEFVLNHLGWSRDCIVADETKVYAGRTVTIEKDGIKLDFNYREDDRVISLSKHLYLSSGSEDSKYRAIVKQIADDFDKLLNQGQHQQHFSQVPKEEF